MAATETAINEMATVLGARWNAAAGKFMDLAAALPDDRFESELVNGTRTCGAVLRHVAYWNRYVADSLNGKKADDSANELSHETCPDMSAVLGELKKSNREISNALKRTLNAKSLELISMALEHLCEHYGQMVVYARIIGITPPSSRALESTREISQ